MSPSPALSVVVPVYNGASTLLRCLEALQAALPQSSEVIVVDDGSTDESAEIARRMTDRGMALRILRHERNRGTSAARNTGWRASEAPLIAFVDADMVLRPAALQALQAGLEGAADLLGAYGTVTLDLEKDLPELDWWTDFVNTSLHWQLSRHGERVASTFTAICLFRREGLERMGGWDEQWFSRYADDVTTRFVLPPQSIGWVPAAEGAHLKRVGPGGLLKHRFNVGYFFATSVAANRSRVGWSNAVLDLRYPLNTAAALGTTGVVGAALLLGPAGLLVLPLASLPMSLHLLANARFCAFVSRQRGLLPGLLSLPLSSIEGYAYGAGLLAGTLHIARRGLRHLRPGSAHAR